MKKRRSFSREFKREAAGMVLDQGFSYRSFGCDRNLEGPVHHGLPDRIRAHALICFIAMVLQRVMRLRLRAHAVTGIGSPERALWSLRRLQTHRTLPVKSQWLGSGHWMLSIWHYLRAWRLKNRH